MRQNINTLPDEVLRLIFAHLPPRSRRESIRLVARRWNRLCDDSAFARQEAVLLDRRYDLATVAPYLLRSPRALFNVSFAERRIRWTPLETAFWRSRGHQLESIRFRDTLLDLLDLAAILRLCPRLRSLSVRCGGVDVERRLLRNFDAFDGLPPDAAAVRHFELHLGDHCRNAFTDYSLGRVLATFPNVAHLRLRLPLNCTHRVDAAGGPRPHDGISVAGIFATLRSMSSRLKYLSLSLKYTCDHTDQFVDISNMLAQLENIENLKLSTFNCLDNSLLQSNNLTNITSLKLPLANIKHPARDYIVRILGAFPNLRALQLDSINKIQVDEILMQKLLTSVLTKLSLQIDEFTFSENARNFDDFRSNRTLEVLKLRCKPTKGGHHESLFSMMVQNFQNIRKLTIHFPSDRIMECIYKYQKNLKNLYLEECYECPRLDISEINDTHIKKNVEEKVSIGNLKDLEILQIDVSSTELLLTEKNLSALILPKLKDFKLKYLDAYNPSTMDPQKCEPVSSAPSYRELARALENSPNLENLNLHFSRAMNEKELEQLLIPLKSLRCIFIKDTCFHRSRCTCTKQVIYDYNKLFKICPSLHDIVHNYIQFYPDAIKKQIEAYPPDFSSFMAV